MQYKLFDQPHSHDLEFYNGREMADHINQSDHRPRLLSVLEEVIQLLNLHPKYSVSDLGCGNGGLLELIPTDNKWGYDLAQSNVADAKAKGRNVTLKDFVNEDIEIGQIVIMTETLEHLVDPHGFLKDLKEAGVKHIVASTPAYETEAFHAPFHLWVWTDDSFTKIFTDAGWKIDKYYKNQFQFVVAS